jgi:hypothetical protein
MSLTSYRRPTPSFLDTFAAFTRNVEARHRYPTQTRQASALLLLQFACSSSDETCGPGVEGGCTRYFPKARG